MSGYLRRGQSRGSKDEAQAVRPYGDLTVVGLNLTTGEAAQKLGSTEENMLAIVAAYLGSTRTNL